MSHLVDAFQAVYCSLSYIIKGALGKCLILARALDYQMSGYASILVAILLMYKYAYYLGLSL